MQVRERSFMESASVKGNCPALGVGFQNSNRFFPAHLTYPLKLQALGKLIFYRHSPCYPQQVEKLCFCFCFFKEVSLNKQNNKKEEPKRYGPPAAKGNHRFQLLTLGLTLIPSTIRLDSQRLIRVRAQNVS